jgi:hypothetical protein
MTGERLPKKEDVLGQVALFDKGLGPERTQQLVFADNPVGVIHEVKKQIERLAIELQRLITPTQSPSGPINFIAIKSK